MCWLCIYVPHWPFRTRRHCHHFAAAALVLFVTGMLLYRTYEESTAQKYREELLKKEFLARLNVAEVTTEKVGDVEDYEAEEREEIKLFEELNPNEVRNTDLLTDTAQSRKRNFSGEPKQRHVLLCNFRRHRPLVP
jgi:hypothetical protein